MNKIAVVTGAATGIGQAIALDLRRLATRCMQMQEVKKS